MKLFRTVPGLGGPWQGKSSARCSHLQSLLRPQEAGNYDMNALGQVEEHLGAGCGWGDGALLALAAVALAALAGLLAVAVRAAAGLAAVGVMALF